MAGKKEKGVIVAVLDWGLGHASRCVPLIRFLQQAGCRVHPASAGAARVYLQTIFPELECAELPAYAPVYPKNEQMALAMLRQLPRFMQTINQENKVIEELIEKTGAELLISDNRYGAYSARVPSLFITHQLQIRPPEGWPLAGSLINFINHRLINRFTACGIPDFPGPHALAGELTETQGIRVPVHHLGPLSALAEYAKEQPAGNYWLALLSGPEPQRTLFEQAVREWTDRQDEPSVIVRGLPGNRQMKMYGKRTEYDFAGGEELAHLISGARGVICRSGYSSLMDLMPFARKVLLVPTPGQTEQIYLAERLSAMGKAQMISQDLLPHFSVPNDWPAMSWPQHNEQNGIQWIESYL